MLAEGILQAVPVPAEATLNDWLFRFSVIELRPLPWPSIECIQAWILWSLEKSLNSGTTLAAPETQRLHLLGHVSTSSGHTMVDYMCKPSLLWYLDEVLGGIEKWWSYTLCS